MIKKVGCFRFDLQSNEGKIDDNIVKLFTDNDYLLESAGGGNYFVFKKVENEDDEDNSDSNNDIENLNGNVDDEF